MALLNQPMLVCLFRMRLQANKTSENSQTLAVLEVDSFRVYDVIVNDCLLQYKW